MWTLLLDCLFPRRSLTGAEGAWVTAAEQEALRAEPVIEEAAALRGQGIAHLDRLVAAMPYDRSPLIHRAVHQFKYRRIPALRHALGASFAEAVRAIGVPRDAVLCPVPLHWSRRFWRGFNQAALLAEDLGRALDLPCAGLLRRTRPTGHQAHRKRAERLTAVRDAFAATRTRIPSHVVLIDDLATTGATLEACACALKDAGAERVEAWVVARG